MHTSLGRPLVALVSAACLAMPATTVATYDRTAEVSTAAVTLAASSTVFESLPSSVRALNLAPPPRDDAEIAVAINRVAELTGVDTATLALQLLTAPFHNIYATSIAVGKAVNAILQLVSLPVSVATYVLANRTTEIPAYVQTVRTNLADAVPNIFRTISSEFQYDRNLFNQLFGAEQSSGDALVAHGATAELATSDAVDRATLLLQLATIPFHNIYGVSIAVGKAINSVVQLFGLPLSVATFVLTNRTTEIPVYINTVRANLAGALPGIAGSVKSEIDYNKNIFQQIFGSPATGSTETEVASHLLRSDPSAIAVLGGGVSPEVTANDTSHLHASAPVEGPSGTSAPSSAADETSVPEAASAPVTAAPNPDEDQSQSDEKPTAAESSDGKDPTVATPKHAKDRNVESSPTAPKDRAPSSQGRHAASDTRPATGKPTGTGGGKHRQSEAMAA